MVLCRKTAQDRKADINELVATMDRESLNARFTLIHALMLRDMKTRFGGSYLGYLVAIAWPLTHLVAIVVISGYVNRIIMVGGDPEVFIATGVAPYILCLYPARLMGYAIELNKPLFLFPIVRPIDLIVSRAIIEFLTAFVVIAIFTAAAYMYGIEILPMNYETGATALLAIVYFGVSVGILSTIISSLFKFWHILIIVIMLILYMTAGVLLPPSAVPPQVQEWLWYNPIFQCVEWLRSAYYEGYGDTYLSKTYLMSLASVCLFLGLLGERYVRGMLLSSK